MALTSLQESFLNSLNVARIKNMSIDFCKTYCPSFTNNIDSVLAQYVNKDSGRNLREFDLKNDCAFCVIYTTDKTVNLCKEMGYDICPQEILAYFAISPGILFKHIISSNDAKMFEQILNFLDDLENGNTTDVEGFVSKLSLENKIDKQEILNSISFCAESKESVESQILMAKQADEDRETRDISQQCYSAKSAIKLNYICTNKNDMVDYLWKIFGFKVELGAMMYWGFVFPYILQATSLIGGTHIFLFAADQTPGASRYFEGSLMRHYNENMCFSAHSDLRAYKPDGEFQCILMIQSIEEAEVFRESFYELLNNKEKPPI